MVGQDVKQETAQKLLGGQGHLPQRLPARVVLPGEDDLISFQADEAGVGDRDAVGVARQVLEDLARAAWPRGRVWSAPPVETRTMPSSATRRSVASAPGRPRRWRQAVKSTTWWCITEARAVDAQWWASWR